MKVVILTGAGISAESGLRTFRAEDGLWEDYSIDEIATPEGYQRNPRLVQDFYNQRRKALFDPKINPNAAHFALAELEQQLGDNFLLITQNVDNLHERAGSKNIIHMHGSLLEAKCPLTEKVYPWTGDLSASDKCHCCEIRQPLRPNIVWFGEMPYEMDRIYDALADCDYFISIGTSGNVYPAAGFVKEANRAHAQTIELNLEPSNVENAFQIKRYGLATKIVPEFIHQLMQNNL
ncbi:NAD-dependent protein deacylase [Actinobacillus delphinicola]|uniref:NAD-dependent protein deacylase n=1 Tax=Actinobacillus delphinicola TaxID=51161 RepID=A0A448TTG6_9PAST|nr:Sir2 family NAD+-dependent deacetylase [Actinobacillus delphinicola]MDG6897475.1 NAD-dependent protein deacylase [Actinobacillus delphinicola]VEJ09300.1 NAD-dependent deacetylase [Actinobacillus delphinicola]